MAGELTLGIYTLETPQKVRSQRSRPQVPTQFMDGTIRKDQTLGGTWIRAINLEWVALTQSQYTVIENAFLSLLGSSATFTEPDGDITTVRLVDDRLPTRVWTAPDLSARYDCQLALIGQVVA